MLVVAGKKKLRKIVVIAVIIAITACVFLYIGRVVSPLVTSLAESKLKAEAANVMSGAALQIQTLSALYGDFYEYGISGDGTVAFVKAKTSNINKFSAFAHSTMQKAANTIVSKKLTLASGAFTGLSLIASSGRSVSVTVIPVGTVETQILSEFSSAGINQTLHRLYLRVLFSVQMIMPIKARDVQLKYDIVFAENIIVGKVPNTYIDSIGQDNILDLLPED